MPALILATLALLLIGWLLAGPWLAARRRQAIEARAFDPAWADILRQRVPYAGWLPVELQAALQQKTQLFLADKTFIGCAGLAITDEIRVTIAAQACLLVLRRGAGVYPALHQVLVYPGSFAVQRTDVDEAGVAHHRREALAGESWAQGQVVLSWLDVQADAAQPTSGRNVVLHEFAHQLDEQTGFANGAPVLGAHQPYQRWSRVLGAEFRRLQDRSALGHNTLFDPYGASSPAEFFAVITETFFGQAVRMGNEHPALFRELTQFYRLDPRHWLRQQAVNIPA